MLSVEYMLVLLGLLCAIEFGHSWWSLHKVKRGGSGRSTSRSPNGKVSE